MSSSSIALSALQARWNKGTLFPIFTGVLAAFAMLSVYLGILTALQSFSHALEQAAQDWPWIGLVALGFGTQIALYTHLRLLVHAAKAIGATAATGAGTGTSTIGMLACCAHHLTDLAPLVALTGASSLSGAISFLSEWKYAFIALGLVVNAMGIFITLRTVRKAKAHMGAMAASRVQAACH